MGGVSENMLPGGSRGYAVDGLGSYLKEFSNTLVLPTEAPQFSDTPDPFFIELRIAVPGAAENHTPAFGVHVSGVLFFGAEKEMRGITARRVVAPVANAHGARDVSVRQPPADAAGYLFERMSVPAGEQPIALGSNGPCPGPTRIDVSRGDATPKPALVLHVVNSALDHLANVTDGARDGKD